MRKSKAQIELTLTSLVLDNKKGFIKCVNTKRRSKENIGLILRVNGHLKSEEEEKVEAVNDFFSSVFNSNRSWATLASELEDHDWWSSDFPSVVIELQGNSYIN